MDTQAAQPRLERRTLQQVIMSGSPGVFLREVNELLTDGWSVVPGTFTFQTALIVADNRTPPRFVDANGMTYQPKFFIALQREETRDPEAARRMIEQAEGHRVPELHGIEIQP